LTSISKARRAGTRASRSPLKLLALPAEGDQRESRLLLLAATFLFLYSVLLSLSPSVRERSWEVTYRLSHWIGFAIWLAVSFAVRRLGARRLPDRDPYLLPLALLLSGWGLLTIWRLDSALGLRQAIWLGVSAAACVAILYAPADLNFLRRYKYLLLTAGLSLTALTLLLGTNPTGLGPRLWLGCCGLYLQPSEPLKLLLVVYLSAYLADRLPIRLRVFPLLLPTVFLSGLALLLLAAQRDLGTASIFICLHTIILYLATDKRRVLLATTVTLLLAGAVGYFFVDIIRVRIDAWINPWDDPSGRSYQIIQSLLAVANGGTIGRGPGMGSPGLVPVAHSDFIFAAIAEESGLAGSVGLLTIFGLILARGLTAALRATDRFRRLLAAGLTAYLGIQALLIVGGNVRLLPLTGVTLPFVSYGGSSLLTAFVALGLLLVIGGQPEEEPAPLSSPKPYLLLAALLGLGLFSASVADTWWAVGRGPDLLTRTDNPRRSIADRYVLRGSLLDRNNEPLDVTRGKRSEYKRVYLYPDLAPLTGYTHPTYGQAGLEASLDGYLRGLDGNPSSLIWWNHLIYGTPPPGLDVRLSLDLELQRQADDLLGTLKGAIVVLNAQSGEILVMASHPAYDPNKLDATGALLAQDKAAPLINRAAQGMYPPGTEVMTPFLHSFGAGNELSGMQLPILYKDLGFYATPQLRMPVTAAMPEGDVHDLRVSPLQMALAAASLSNAGMRPAPRIAIAVDTPQQGWVVLPALSEPVRVFPAEAVKEAVLQMTVENQPYWEWYGRAGSAEAPITWYLAGTLPGWQGTPLTVVVLIEGDYPSRARNDGRRLILATINP
jgi:cell division protein FtsW (lipid II flippase)